MRARTLILLVVALVLAGGTTMMARMWLASQKATVEASPIAVPTPAKSVLIARSGVQRGQLLKAEDLSWEPWPEGGIDKNYILIGTKNPEDFAGWVARLPISAGEPVTEAKIIAPGNRGFLAAVLHPGMRAVSVPVSVTSGISGFVFPGDQVDLLVTYAYQEGNRPGQVAQGPIVEHKVSETVLRDIRVIAIDQKLDSKAGEAVVAKTATFEVTPKQSEIIALADQMGKLSLSLRSLVPGPGEPKPQAGDSPVQTASAAAPETFTIDSDVSPLLPGAGKNRATSADSGVVTILRGGQSSATSATAQP
ncbi:MAG: Flp pilus assembly protein CpaB [Alphaproteobacteria bacterium]|nr:Flp pilus assembly protein CpaB [Alphaproteobacteria bacterium]